MATTFKNAVLAPTGTSGVLYTCPVGKTAVVQMLQASSKTVTYNLTAALTDASDFSTTNFLTNIAIPFGGSMGLLAGNLVLEAGDSLSFTASASNQMVILASIAEF